MTVFFLFGNDRLITYLYKIKKIRDGDTTGYSGTPFSGGQE